MKKVFLLFGLIGVLTACGSDDNLYKTRNEKEQIIKSIYDQKDENAKLEKEKIIKELLKKVKKGDRRAKEEVEEWQEVESVKRMFM